MTISDQVEMQRDIEKIIKRYYTEELKELRFKSMDAEENVWYMIDNLCEDIGDMISDNDRLIGYEISDSIIHEDNRDMESFLYNCVL